jgi:hypothetical protein
MDCEQQSPPSPVSAQGLSGGGLAQSHGPSLVELLSYSLSPRGARRHTPSSTQDGSQFNAYRHRATLLSILNDAIVITEEEGAGCAASHRSTHRDTLNEASRVNHHPDGEPPSPQRASVPAAPVPNDPSEAHVSPRRGKKHDGGDPLRPTQ